MTHSTLDPAPVPHGFSCPNCRDWVIYGTPDCPHCHMHLIGPDAVRLWQVDQQIGELQEEKQTLHQRLLSLGLAAVASSSEIAAPPALSPAFSTALSTPIPTAGPDVPTIPPLAPPAGPTAQRPRRTWSAERLFLGLGALLLLSGSAVFVAVAWSWLGLVGQAAVMVALTVATGACAIGFQRRGLTAASVTFGALCSALMWCDVIGARVQSLPGADALSTPQDVVVGALLTAALTAALGRGVGAFASLYRTLVAVGLVAALTAAPFAIASDLFSDLPTASMILLITVTAMLAAALGLVDRLLPGSDAVPTTVYALTAWAWGAVAAVSTLIISLDSATTWSTRAAVMAIALAWPATAFIGGRLLGLTQAGALAAVLLIAVGWLAIPGLSPVALSILAVTVAAVLVLRPRLDGVLLAPLVTTLALTELFALTDQVALAVTAGALALAAARSAWVRRSVVWLVGAELAIVVAVVRLAFLHDSPALWLGVGSAYTIGHLALARAAATDRTHLGRGLSQGLEVVGMVAAGLSALLTFAAIAPGGAWFDALAWVGIAVGLSIYTTAPQRAGWSYPAAAAWVFASWAMPHASAWQVVEVYSLPAALALAATGLWQHRRTPALPSLVTMLPALVAAFAPSTLLAVSQGDAVRLIAVTTLGVLALVVGVHYRWQAPIAVAVVVLGIVGITQGGPWVGAMPAWSTLSLAGIALLVLGVRWEAAVLAGRRTGEWIATLR